MGYLNLNTEVIHKYVFELRYDFGQLYWDRSGRVAKQILNEFDDWDFDSVDGGRCQLSNREQNVAFNFGPERLDLSQSQNADVDSLMDVGEFAKFAEDATARVIESLELEFFSRIGFRVLHLYPASDRENAEQLVGKLKLFQIDRDMSDVIRAPTEMSFRIVTERDKNMLRIAVSPFEQNIPLSPRILLAAKTEARQLSRNQRRARIDQLKAKKKIEHYPQFGVLLDLDAYLEEPPVPTDLSISEFILEAYADFSAVKSEVLASCSDG